ncbi:uncharacterized protein Cpr50Ca [Eurosta solidaginis]|uniref:uncharacterized protein Cpr50Ca n=1 Tax=Eurosta solidaginis TaxID=178769 RepID=UPI003530EA42
MLAYRKLVAFVGATITLAVLFSSRAHGLKTPDLEVFANYEDMQRYINARSQRSMRFIENPTYDSYINAYNDHHESATLERQRRATKEQQMRKLPNEPKMLKFGIEDAVEPSAEIKELIRHHRSREEELQSGVPADKMEMKATMHQLAEKHKPKTTAQKRTTRATRTRVARSKRPKRAAYANVTPNKQQFNFQVKLIPFDTSEAREPDEETKALIRRMRNLELEQYRKGAPATSTAGPTKIRVNRNAPAPTALQPLTVAIPTINPAKYYRPKTGKLFMKRKGKRVKRSEPQMIRFGHEDARQPDAATMEHLRLARENHKQANKQGSNADDKTGAINKREARIDSTETRSADKQNVQPMREEVDEEGDSDLSNGESKRMFVYNKAPVTKTKKSIGSLPAEVQKIIEHMLKDHGAGGVAKGAANGGAKAYLKYIPAQKVDYSQLKSLYGGKVALTSTYSNGGAEKFSPASYVKYIPPYQKAEQVQIHPVPVVEKVRYVYAPVAVGYSEEKSPVQAAVDHAIQAAYSDHNVNAVAEGQAAHAYGGGDHGDKLESGAEGGGQAGGAMSQPIIVQEASGQAAPVYHKYAADLSYALEGTAPMEIAITGRNFRPSKPDPILDENKFSEASAKQVQGGYSGTYGYKAFGGDGQKSAAEYEKQAEFEEAKYRYEVENDAEPEKEAEAPLIKIEYHGPADSLKQNFKELPEFKQLSTLVGKSTEDQIHGLTYLLAKEMQNKLKLQRHKLQVGEGQGDQTKTSPILFPVEEKEAGDEKKQEQQQQAAGMQGRLIGMAKAKEYIPIVEQPTAAEQKASGGGGGGGGGGGSEAMSGAKENKAMKAEPKSPLPNSFMSYGLSPNYEIMKGGEGGGMTKFLVEQIMHHPAPKYKAYGGGGRGEYAKSMSVKAEKQPVGASSEQSLSFGDEMQYASKYAFGYRIRDFHTGNDFGHKQNRDLDGVTRGQYHILLPDGRIQNVIYHADDTGFHADVSFETGH